MSTRHLPALGPLAARVLTGAWRVDPEPAALTQDELDALTPALLGTGAGSLGWWRVRGSGELRQAYRLHSLQAALHQHRLEQLAGLLGSAGIEILLCKGWSIARLYPEAGLRPYGDLDVCIRAHDFERSRELLAAQGDPDWNVDLHQQVTELADRPDLWARSIALPVGEATVRIMSAEDQLRHLALHFVRHGGWRPLWLCDVAVAVEAAAADFDWDYCLAGDRHRADWVRCVIGLARHLLGARIPAALQMDMPAWLPRTILQEWSADRRGDSHTRDDQPIRQCWTRPWQLLHALRCRWPNAIEAGWRSRRSPFGWRLGAKAHLILGRACGLLRRRNAAVAGFAIHED